MSSYSLSPTPVNEVSRSSILKSNGPLPEQWMLVKDWNIERREGFETWRSSASSQIERMYEEMRKSVEEHPEALLK